MSLPNVGIGDHVDVLVKTSSHKRGKWLVACSFTGIDRTTVSVNVPGLQVKLMPVALEDCPAFVPA